MTRSEEMAQAKINLTRNKIMQASEQFYLGTIFENRCKSSKNDDHFTSLERITSNKNRTTE